MTKRMTGKDGASYGVFNQGNGDYVAQIDDSGTHYAPPQHQSLPTWSDRECMRQLREAVRQHDEDSDFSQ